MSSILYPITCPYSIPYCSPSTYASLFCQFNLSLFSAHWNDCFFYYTWWSWQHFSSNLDPLCDGNNLTLWPHPRPIDWPLHHNFHFIWHHAARAALQLPCAPFLEIFSMMSSHLENSTESRRRMNNKSCYRLKLKANMIWRENEGFKM